MACTHFCQHNQQYFDQKRAEGLIRGEGLPQILGALAPKALSFASKVAVTSVLTNALKFFMGLAQTSDMSAEKRKRVLKQYTKHLLSRQNLIDGPTQQVLMGEILSNVPTLAKKLEMGVVSAKDAAVNLASSAKDALDFGAVVPDGV